MTIADLIYDIGVHHGEDTRFYLDKGFRVVGVEANPALCEGLKADFAAELQSGRFVLIDKAIAPAGTDLISFFINNDKDDWSSTIRGVAEKGAYEAVEVQVATTSLSDIFDAHGVPYYLKCDIEGSDATVVRQLLRDGRRPPYVSIEAMYVSDLAYLHACGYDDFQIVNQTYNFQVQPPHPPSEGAYVQTVFTPHMSGLFGRELNPANWITFDEAADRFLKWTTLRLRDPLLAGGWLDFHARL